MNKQKQEILNIIKSNNGLTITELVDKSKYSRSTIRTILANLEGAEKITYRKIGMAKMYTQSKSKAKNDNQQKKNSKENIDNTKFSDDNRQRKNSKENMDNTKFSADKSKVKSEDKN